MFTATKVDGPMMIRYPRGRGSLVDWQCPLSEVQIGKGYCLKEGADVAVLSFGPIGNEVTKAIAEQSGRSIAHYDMVFCKPLDIQLLKHVFSKFSHVVTVEDGTLVGGFGSAVLEEANRVGYKGAIDCLGLPDSFVPHGTVAQLYHLCGIDAEGIASKLMVNDND